MKILGKDLPWLALRLFVRVTWTIVNHNTAFLRIYLIPEDSESLRTKLWERHRDLKTGTRLMKRLLSLVTRCPLAWQGCTATATPELDFFRESPVSHAHHHDHSNYTQPP